MFKSSKVLLSLIISISCTNSMDYVNDNSSTKNWQNVFLSTISNNGGDDINLVSLLDPDYINKKESFNKQLTNTYNTKLDINNINLKLNGNENNNTMENKQLPNNNKNNNPLLQKKRGQKSEIKMEIIKNEIIKKYGDIFYDLFDENKYKEIPLEHKSRYNRIVYDFNTKLCNIIKKENNTNKSIAYSTMMNNKQKYEKELSQFREYKYIFKDKLSPLIAFHEAFLPLDEQNE